MPMRSRQILRKPSFTFTARLPFKRLNPEPKDSQEPKRPRVPPCPEPATSDGENEAEAPPASARNGPALVNGRGPLDGFFCRGSAPAESMCIDLTGEESPVKQPAKPAAPACVPPEGKQPAEDKPALTGDSRGSGRNLQCKKGTLDSKAVSEAEDDSDEEESDEEEEESEAESVTRLDTTQDSESEAEEQDESMKNESMLSPSSVSSVSAAESSPDQAKNRSLNAVGTSGTGALGPNVYRCNV